MTHIWEHAAFDHHEMVLFCRDMAAGLNVILAIHNTTLGPAMGGCRMYPYSSEAEAVQDVLRLSRGMTYKYAVSGLDYGGAKAVIVGDPNRDKSPALLSAFGRIVERLAGQYTTAEDVGIDTADVRCIAAETRYVRNLPLNDTGEGSLCTALGVMHAISASLGFLGLNELRECSVAVEGLGKVGLSLCELLHGAGALLTVFDVDRGKVADACRRFGAKPSAIGSIHSETVDVYAPCALGKTLNARSIPEIKAKVVVGAANNQLESAEDGFRLWRRGILYCPDYVANAGAVLAVAASGNHYTREAALTRIGRIADTAMSVFRLADSEGIPTSVAAERIATRRLGAIDDGR